MASPRLTEPLLTRPERQGSRNGQLPDSYTQKVREELERILASPVFRNSKRNSSLLKHVVERSLEGRPEDLKERNIGVDVFGRASDYDTNTDHVVRSVAGEVRRRLAQYYMDLGHDSEIRIELQAGSYVPQFRRPADVVLQATVSRAPVRFRWPSLTILGAIAVAALAGILAVRLLSPTRAFDRFWNPFFGSPNPALLCVGGGGQPGANANGGMELSISDFEHQPWRHMHTSDALALADLAAMLQSNGKPYRIVNRAGSTSFRDLQAGPFVLIGGMNNEWTLRLTSGLRFGFERLPTGARVVDRQNPTKGDWSVRPRGTGALISGRPWDNLPETMPLFRGCAIPRRSKQP
jgi:hypothetical protein